MNIIGEITEHLASMVDGVLIIYFLNSFFGKRNKKNMIPDIVFVILLFMTAQFLTQYFIIQNLIVLTLIFVYSYVFLEGNILYKILSGFGIVFIISISSLVILQLFSLLTGLNMESVMIAGGSERIMTICISKIILFFIAYTVVHKANSVLRLKKNEWKLIVIYFLSTMIISMVLLNIVVLVEMDNIQKLKMVMVTILLIAITVISFGLLGRINRQNEFETVNKILKVQLEQQKDTVVQTQKNYELTMKFRHDMNRELTVLLELIKNDRTNDMVKRLEELLNPKEYRKVISVSENQIISSVLNEKVSVCVEKEIEITLDVTAAIDGDRELDVAVMLSNILDNAIEAEEKFEENRKIYVGIFSFKDKYNILVKNYIEESVLDNNPKMVTSKKNKKGHGIGIQSVRDTVDRYNGSFELYEEKKEFAVHIIVPNSEGI